MIYKTSNTKKDKTCDFQKFKTIRSSGRETYSGILTLHDALQEKINVKDAIDKYKESTRLKTPDKEEYEELTFKNGIRVLRGR